MKKMMKVLSGKKGFTLIECVIAIAVFAALTGMVLMIMSQTIQLSKKASDAETDLNNLVQKFPHLCFIPINDWIYQSLVCSVANLDGAAILVVVHI